VKHALGLGIKRLGQRSRMFGAKEALHGHAAARKGCRSLGPCAGPLTPSKGAKAFHRQQRQQRSSGPHSLTPGKG